MGQRIIDWGVAAAPLAGQLESGDKYLVKLIEQGALLAVVDGLGHGPEAMAAASCAVATLEGHACEPITSLLRRCHEALRGTRGVVMSMAAFDDQNNTMTWLGIGNVEGVVLRPCDDKTPRRTSLLLRGGVVGYNIPRPHVSSVPLVEGDTLLFATDGVHGLFWRDLALGGPPQRIAEHILAHHSKGTDDALVLVARYLGGGA